MMDSSTKESLDELIVDRVRQKGGSVEVTRGKFAQRNVARTLELAGFNRRVVYAAVLRLVATGRLVRKDLPSTGRGKANKMRLSLTD